MKIGIVILFICFSLSVFQGVFHPSFTSLSGFDSSTLTDVVDNGINYGGNAAESLVAIYQDFMASSKISNFFKTYIPLDQNPGTIILLSCCFVGLLGYGRKRMKK